MRRPFRDLVSQFSLNFLQLTGFREAFVDVCINKWSWVFCLLSDYELVAYSKSIFEEEGRAAALHNSFCKNANPISQYVSFIHVMGCQYYDLVFLVLL